MPTVVQNNSNSRRDFFASVETALPEFLNNGWLLSLHSEKQNQLLIGWGEWREDSESLAVLDQGTIAAADSCFLYTPDSYLTGSTKAWRYTPSWDCVDLNRFVSTVLTAVGAVVNGKDQGFQWVEPARSQFDEAFLCIQEGMKKRGLKKAVPVVFSTAQEEIGQERKLALLGRLLRSLQSSVSEGISTAYAYGFWQSGARSEGLLGLTPELLFQQNSMSALETMALAGTRSKEGGEKGKAELLNDLKERNEHQIVVDDIQEVLSKVGSVAIGETRVVELPSLLHLQTAISANLVAPKKFSEIVHLLHPTPALGLAPRALGFDEMLKWDDPIARGRFGAPFGAIFSLDGVLKRNCVVAIRNIQWQDQEVRLGSGCGVVAESTADREWRELELKRSSVKKALGL
jgi:menaquinone-specific isochorismate synthase